MRLDERRAPGGTRLSWPMRLPGVREADAALDVAEPAEIVTVSVRR